MNSAADARVTAPVSESPQGAMSADGRAASGTAKEASPSASRLATAIVLEGFLDAVEARRIYGWVRNPEDTDERCTVEVSLDGELLGRIPADRERPDLKQAGIGDGRYAFEFAFHKPLDEQARSLVSARAFSVDGTASLVLERFDAHSSSDTGSVGNADSLQLALGRIAAHQVREFSRQAARLESLVLIVDGLDRRTQERPRIGDPPRGGDELGERLGALEGMHLRFDRALKRLIDEREAFSQTGTHKRARAGWLLIVAMAFAAGLLLGQGADWFSG